MAAEGFEYVAAIKDEMSGPIGKILGGLLKWKQSIKDMSLGTDKAKKSVKDAKPDLAGFSAMLGMSIVGAELAADAIEKTVGAVKDLAVALVEGTIRLLRFGSEAAKMRSQRTAGLALYGKDHADGEAIYGMIDKMSRNINLPQEKVFEAAKGFLEAGVHSQYELQQSTKSVTDLMQVGNDAAASKITEVISRAAKSRTTMGGRSWAGVFTISAEELRGTGASLDQFFAEYAKQTGRGVGDIRRLWQVGRLNADQGIKALNAVVHKGRAGAEAKSTFMSLDDLGVKFHETMKRLFSSLEHSEGMQKLIATGKQVIAIFDTNTKSGKTLGDVIVSAMNRIAKAAAWMVATVTLGILKLEIGFLKFYIKLIPLIKWLQKHDAASKFIAALKIMGIMLAIVAVALGGVAAAGLVAFIPMLIIIAALVAGLALLALGVFWVYKSFKYLANHAKQWAKSAEEMASNFIDSLITGLRNGIAAVKSAAKQVGDALTGGVKTALDAHSPSRKMIEIGRSAAQGMQIGLDSSAPTLTMGAPNLGSLGQGGRSVHVDVGGVHIGEGVKNREELQVLLEPVVADLFERVALELG